MSACRALAATAIPLARKCKAPPQTAPCTVEAWLRANCFQVKTQIGKQKYDASVQEIGLQSNGLMFKEQQCQDYALGTCYPQALLFRVILSFGQTAASNGYMPKNCCKKHVITFVRKQCPRAGRKCEKTRTFAHLFSMLATACSTADRRRQDPPTKSENINELRISLDF